MTHPKAKDRLPLFILLDEDNHAINTAYIVAISKEKALDVGTYLSIQMIGGKEVIVDARKAEGVWRALTGLSFRPKPKPEPEEAL